MIDKSNLGGWAIGEELLEEARGLLPPHGSGTILEIGSGTGTLELRKIARVISIEHDPEWYQPSGEHEGSSFTIMAPLNKETGWYETNDIEKILARHYYDLIIVDGPKRSARHGFLHNLSLFRTGAAIILDDTHRQEIKEMAELLAGRLGRPFVEREAQGHRRFAIFQNVQA